LSEVIGREPAAKALAMKEQGQLSGLDLEFGGEGMKSFYGDMTPEGYQSGIVGTRLQKLVKGLDPEAARIETTGIPDPVKGTFYEAGEPLEVVRAGDGWGIRYGSGEVRGGWVSEKSAAETLEGQRRMYAANPSPQKPYPSVKITPAMREKILKEGLPLFNVAALSALLSRILGQGQSEEDEQ
jgi:hypothetical protein